MWISGCLINLAGIENHRYICNPLHQRGGQIERQKNEPKKNPKDFLVGTDTATTFALPNER